MVSQVVTMCDRETVLTRKWELFVEWRGLTKSMVKWKAHDSAVLECDTVPDVIAPNNWRPSDREMGRRQLFSRR